MAFWIFMLVMELLIPFTMIGFGRSFLKHAPKEINAAYGYRTSMSMKNKDTWEFAHKYSGALWYRWGLILLPISVIVMFCVIGKDKDTVGMVGGILCFLQMIPLIGVLIPTERALRKNFDQDGNRRKK